MLSATVRSSIETILTSRHEGQPVVISSVKPLGGGCINEAASLVTNAGQYFVKWNNAKKYPGMFEAEHKGLQLLRSTGAIHIPGVVHEGIAGEHSFLVLEMVTEGKKTDDFWEDFGRSMAKMHRHTWKAFGLDHDNYIGSLPQSNAPHDKWTEFFICERLEPQLKRARDEGKLGRNAASHFNHLFLVLDEIFPPEKPALLHGDLWSGNFMISPNGRACIYDPAVYYGHREMDIAMTKLFGGFNDGFYAGYTHELPLEKGWEKRVDVCNLYSLLVHVNLFGGGYAAQVEGIICKY